MNFLLIYHLSNNIKANNWDRKLQIMNVLYKMMHYSAIGWYWIYEPIPIINFCYFGTIGQVHSCRFYALFTKTLKFINHLCLGICGFLNFSVLIKNYQKIYKKIHKNPIKFIIGIGSWDPQFNFRISELS